MTTRTLSASNEKAYRKTSRKDKRGRREEEVRQDNAKRERRLAGALTRSSCTHPFHPIKRELQKLELRADTPSQRRGRRRTSLA